MLTHSCWRFFFPGVRIDRLPGSGDSCSSEARSDSRRSPTKRKLEHRNNGAPLPRQPWLPRLPRKLRQPQQLRMPNPKEWSSSEAIRSGICGARVPPTIWRASRPRGTPMDFLQGFCACILFVGSGASCLCCGGTRKIGSNCSGRPKAISLDVRLMFSVFAWPFIIPTRVADCASGEVHISFSQRRSIGQRYSSTDSVRLHNRFVCDVTVCHVGRCRRST